MTSIALHGQWFSALCVSFNLECLDVVFDCSVQGIGQLEPKHVGARMLLTVDLLQRA